MAELKPCPFCGKMAFIKKDIRGMNQSYSYKAFCIGCLANTAWEDNIDGARETWNKRVADE